MESDLFTSHQAAALVGCSYRRVHYLLEGDVIHPVQRGLGSGAKTWWSTEDVRILSVCVALREMGATDATLRPLEGALRALPDEAWCEVLVVTPEGAVRSPASASAGWLLDLGRLLPAPVSVTENKSRAA